MAKPTVGEFCYAVGILVEDCDWARLEVVRMVEDRKRRRWFDRVASPAVVCIVAAGAFLAVHYASLAQGGGQSPSTISPQALTFEVASVRPNAPGDHHYFVWFNPGRFTTSSTIKRLIAFAYNANDFQISARPAWLDSETYSVDAKVPDSLVKELQKLPFDERREKIDLMIRALLAERFKLQARRETKELPVYALVVAKNGNKLREAAPDETYAIGEHPGFGKIGAGQLKGDAIPVSAPRGMTLAWLLSVATDRIVLDRTGLKGRYDVTLQWSSDAAPAVVAAATEGSRPGTDNAPPSESPGPSIFSAIQEQLGLKLESARGPVDVIVIEHIERPSGN